MLRKRCPISYAKFQHDPPHSSGCIAEKPQGGGWHPTPLPGRGLTRAPLGAVFQNNCKTVADIDTKFGVPYSKSIRHRMTKFCRNRPEIVEKLTFLWGHFTPILTKIGSMSRTSPKIGFCLFIWCHGQQANWSPVTVHSSLSVRNNVHVAFTSLIRTYNHYKIHVITITQYMQHMHSTHKHTQNTYNFTFFLYVVLL